MINKPTTDVTIKRGPHGYYMDVPRLVASPSGEPVEDDNDRALIVLKLSYQRPDIKDPFEGYEVLYPLDVNGVPLKINSCRIKHVEQVRRVKDQPGTFLDEFVIAKDSSLWDFLEQVDLDPQ